MNNDEIYYQADIEDFLKKKPFIIAKTYISHGKKHFPLGEIKGIIRKVTKNTVIGNVGELSMKYDLSISNKSDKTIDINLLAYGAKKAEIEKQYADINEAIERVYLRPKIDHYIRRIEEGGSFKIEEFEFSGKGLRIEKKRLFRKPLQADIPWNDINWEFTKLDFLKIGSRSNTKAFAEISRDTDYQTLELYMFLESYKPKG